MKNNILKTIEKVYQVAKKSELDDNHFINYSNELKLLKEYFKLNDENPALLATIIGKTCFECEDIKSIAKYLGLEDIAILKYMKDIESFIEKNILLSKREIMDHQYWINPIVKKIITDGLDLTDEILTPKTREYSLKSCLAEMGDIPKTDTYEKMMFDENFWNMLESYQNLPLIKFILDNFNRETIDAYLFLDTISDAITMYDNDYNTELHSTVNDCTFDRYQSFNYVSNFIAGRCIINKLQLIEAKPCKFRSDQKLKLSDKAVGLIKELEGIEFTQVNIKNLIEPTKIKPVELFYNSFELSQLTTIEKSISIENFNDIQSNLAKINLPTGVTVVFFGAPGTGKTESVYQIARKLGRPIFKVDISNSKSSWYGESEKLIKKIFTDYQKMKDNSEVCPILLLNEADAILSKRKEQYTSNVSNTENAIQNILLEELENFEGILFATTNLVGNLDAAFERRFLFKVKIDPPTIENAAKIWRNKLNFISEQEATYLAENFAFSGGEMQNIARKSILNAIVNSKPIHFHEIVDYCKNEKWQTNKKAIGF